MSYISWTPEEDAQLRELRTAGQTFPDISAVMGKRTPQACSTRWRAIRSGPRPSVGRPAVHAPAPEMVAEIEDAFRKRPYADVIAHYRFQPYSLPLRAILRVREAMLARGEKPYRKPAEARAVVVPLTPEEHGCALLHDAMESYFKRQAKQRGCSVEAVRLLSFYGADELQRMMARAA